VFNYNIIEPLQKVVIISVLIVFIDISNKDMMQFSPHLKLHFSSATLSSIGSWPATLDNSQFPVNVLPALPDFFFWPLSAVKVFGRKLFGVRGNNS